VDGLVRVILGQPGHIASIRERRKDSGGTLDASAGAARIGRLGAPRNLSRISDLGVQGRFVGLERRTMIPLFRTTLALLLLTAGAAAIDSAASTSTRTAQAKSESSGTIRLSPEQEKIVWQRIKNHPASAPPWSQLPPPVGQVVPQDFPLEAIPDDVSAEVSSLKGYDYAIVQDRLLIVDRSNKTVVHEINKSLQQNY
jgi:hypothetical protein